jgi:hypothetical protein
LRKIRYDKKSRALPFCVLFVVFMVFASYSSINVCAQTSISKPSVPEFTVAVVSHPFEVPPYNLTDTYTGVVTTYLGYHEENSSVEVTIKNQPFVSTQMTDGNWTHLYYEVRFKPTFEPTDWVYYGEDEGTTNQPEYTVISMPTYLCPANLRNGSQIDFQVQARIGYEPEGRSFNGESSDWSNTQTLMIGNTTLTQNTPTETAPAPTNQVGVQVPVIFGLNWTEITIITFLSIIVIAIMVAILFMHKRSIKTDLSSRFLTTINKKKKGWTASSRLACSLLFSF